MIKIAGIQGKVAIGDTEGSLRASVLGSDNLKAGKVRDAALSIQGSGDIDVSFVEGNLSMNIQGSGDVRVHGGSVTMLAVNIMGSGDARFNGKTIDANLSVIGSGDISVAFCKNRPNKNLIGSGDISVANW